ncbi:alkaline phosphatase PafA [Oceanihabitans sediminis]|uniref:glycerophosphocholine cholinephosphodiesterase n=1 Tax=Oceanihabitans sediminis TaxID=1812012 RepID=A0A368P636_9FLAO|nr:alkaline phosphatase PafA [Oceanihabitans sediminis]MDX1278524.1 alkaline phosphatase PafA [Oceanihabitans sediminis]MDX1774284.1 alkaline phosphatase PafA [Oceanihabitans sediminis]RBP29914.1 putative AlkP superfamily pyrophosphatase or phosphodiesterase [Oceanihabitans sediminis]RCU57249.1 alkaline phosphatase family protein [Oceanihabitans sediminis]
MKPLFYVFVFSLFFSCKAQTNLTSQTVTQTDVELNTRPKLVVGIVVDQMRYDYLTRFYNKFGEGGFKKLINQGFNCKNNHYNYVPTYTGPGHASVYTGTTPKYHGIIANNWYDKEIKESVYCAGDDTVNPIGTEDAAGQMSPKRMMTTSFADENRLFTQMRGKTIGVSMKDRGAVLPAGHTANAAYWFHGMDEGNWITSSFYMNELPKWVNDFNASGAADSYLKTWNTLYDIDTYTESGSDLNNFEGGFKGKETATFPYDLKALSKDNKGYDILKATAYGNALTTDFAIAAIDGEQLGQDEITDVLALSYSSTDYVGHNFGVNSKEIQDTYLRLDKDIERLINTLDEKVGKGEYTLFLTSDHGAVDVPSYLQSVNIPAGYINSRDLRKNISEFAAKKFGASDLIENGSNNQIFLNRERIALLGLDLEAVQKALVDELITYKNIDKVYTATTMQNTGFSTGIEELLQNGYNQKRSGDIVIVYEPAVISYSRTGSTHGSGLNYDTHVPLLFYGKGIKQGSTLKKTRITDIAPTMSALLGTSFPNGATGVPLEFVIEEE